MPDENVTILHLLRAWAASQPGAAAVIHETDEGPVYEVTFEQLWARVSAAAAQIASASKQGDRAILLYPSGTDFVAAFFGCILARRIAVPASIPHNERAIDRTVAIIRDSGARLIVTTPALMLKLQTTLQRIAFNDGEAPRVMAIDSTELAEPVDEISCQPSDIAFLQYTSGSTSHPKGVVVANANLSDNLRRIQDVFGFEESTRLINWLPVHHDMGLIGGILAPLAAGRLTVLMSPMEFVQRPIRWLQLVTRYDGTISGAPNFAYDACVARISDEQAEGLDLSSWRVAFNGSEPIRAQTLARFASRFQAYGFSPDALFPCYGLAESTLLVAGKGRNEYRSVKLDRDELQRKHVRVTDDEKGRTLVGCGPPIEDHDVLIVDPETTQRVGENEIGEVWVSGPSVCEGYWNREEETLGTFSARVGGVSEERFLRTGDLGLVHDGQLYISGRLKNIVIIRGLNYACEDIEDLSQGSHPAVAGAPCAAFGVEGPTGEQLVVVQEVSRAHLGTFDRDEVRASIQESIVLNHGVGASDVVLALPRALPRTTSGKLQRPQARQLYLAGKLRVVSEPPMVDAETATLTRKQGRG